MAKLKCETNTAAVEVQIRFAAIEAKLGRRHIETVFEHGQWWLTNKATGAQWSVNDAEGAGSFNGFSFEQVTQGNE